VYGCLPSSVAPKPHQQLRPEIPEVMAHIVLKLLAKTAEERYQSTYGLAQDLQRCCQASNHQPQ
jgi:hypothetical protein